MKSVNPVSGVGTVNTAQRVQVRTSRTSGTSTVLKKDSAVISEKARDLEAQLTGRQMQEEASESPATEAVEEAPGTSPATGA